MIFFEEFSSCSLAGMALALTFPVNLALANENPTEAKAFLASGMTISQATSKAEEGNPGTAMSVAWEPQGSDKMAFEVELAQTDGTVSTVLVAPK